MPSSYLVQVQLNHDTGLPEDRTINTWSCQTSATGNLAAVAAFMEQLETFYLAIDANFGTNLSNGCEMRAYDRADPTPRVPVATNNFLMTVGTTQLPNEVALVMSFQGTPVAGQSQARRRGRVYLGPWSSSVNDTATGRPTSALLTSIDSAATALLTASLASADWRWTVWSQTDGWDVEITNGWIDNSWDTQRRRGIAPTTRTSFP